MRHLKLQRQRGAALVIGLILLMVITLLAVVGMNISNTELAGATGEQLRLRAFNAAETGLETRLQTLREDGDPAVAEDERPAEAVENSPVNSDDEATDNYTTSTRYIGEGMMISRYSAASFAGFYFEVDSTGTSSRNAVAQHTAGAYLVNGVDGSPPMGPVDPDNPPVVNP
jgi:type IV pilus assembly protein PilX